MISFACAAPACMEAKDKTGRVKEGDRCSEQRSICCCLCQRVVCFPNLAPGKLQKELSFSSYLSLGSISQKTKESLVGKSCHTFRVGCGKLFSI